MWIKIGLSERIKKRYAFILKTFDLERYLELVDLVRDLRISANKVINSQVPDKFSTSLTTKPPFECQELSSR